MRKRPLPHFDVAVGVISRRGRFLICQRRKGSHFAGRWEFPGGKRHAGESWQACLRREVAEEIGVTLRSITPLGRIRHRYPHKSVRLEIFRCVIARGTPKPLASKALRWVSRRQLARYPFPPANKALLAALGAKLRLTPRRGIIKLLQPTGGRA